MFLDDSDLHPRVRDRIELTRELVEPHAAVDERVAAIGETRIERLVSLVLLGDLVSLYLAVLAGVDPAPIDVLERAQAALARRPLARSSGRAARVPNIDTIVVRLAPMQALTINEAAATTGWSPRMLRYVEQAGSGRAGALGVGLPALRARRAAAPAHAQGAAGALRGGAVGRRVRRAAGARRRAARRRSRAGCAAEARRPEDVDADDWLRFEQDKHERLLAAA